MKRLLGFALVLAAVVACSPSDIEASHYDQSCAKDDDCVQVSELQTRGTDCVMGCSAKAINKKDKAQYDEDLADAQYKCGSMAWPFCDVTGSPVCVQGKCEMK